MKLRSWLLVVGALSVPAAWSRACTNVYGIPAECRMRVLALGRGAAASPSPVEVASVRMDRTWASAACVPSPDGAANVVFTAEDELEVHYQGRRRRLRRDPRQPTSAHAALWDARGRRFAFFAPRTDASAPVRIAIADLQRLGSDVPYEVVYTAQDGRLPVGITWAPAPAWAAAERALLVHERRLGGGSGLVRVDLEAGEQVDLVTRTRPDEAPIDFVVGGEHRPSLRRRRVLVGAGAELLALEASGELRRLPLPATGLYNVELSGDGGRAALFYRRPVTGPEGQTMAGVYVADLDAALAGRPGAIEQLDGATDVHTLWLSDDGVQVLWATPDRLCVRGVAAGEAPRVLFERGDALFGRDPDVRLTGAAFDRAGSRVAVTLGREVHVVDLGTGSRAQLAQVRRGCFAAQPWWSGDRVVVTTYEDLSPSPRER